MSRSESTEETLLQRQLRERDQRSGRGSDPADLRARLRTGVASDDVIREISTANADLVPDSTIERIVTSDVTTGIDPSRIVATAGTTALVTLVQDALIETPVERREREQREAEAQRLAEQQRSAEQQRLEREATQAIVRELERGTPEITRMYADLTQAQIRGDHARVSQLQQEIGGVFRRNGDTAIETIAARNPELAPFLQSAFSTAQVQYGQQLDREFTRTRDQVVANERQRLEAERRRQESSERGWFRSFVSSVGSFAKDISDSLGFTDLGVGLAKVVTAPAQFFVALSQGKSVGDALGAVGAAYVDGFSKLGKGAFRLAIECTGIADLGRACYYGYKLLETRVTTGKWDQQLLMEFSINAAAAALSIGTLIATAGFGVVAVGAVKGFLVAGAKKLATEGVKACCKEAAEQIAKKCVAVLGREAMEKLGKEVGEVAARESLQKLEKAVGKETLEKVQREIAEKGAKAGAELLEREVGAVAKKLAQEEAEKVVDKQVRAALKESLDKLISGEVKNLAEALSENNVKALAKALGKTPDDILKQFGKFQRSAMAHHVGSGAMEEVMKKELTERISKEITEHLIQKEGKILCEAFERTFRETMEKGLKEAAEKGESYLGRSLKAIKEADKEVFERTVKNISDDAAKAAREAFEKKLEKVVKEVVEEAVEKGLKEARKRRYNFGGAVAAATATSAAQKGRVREDGTAETGYTGDPMRGNGPVKGWNILAFDNSWKTFAEILEAAERDGGPRRRTVGGDTGTSNVTVPEDRATTLVKRGSDSNTPTTAA